MSTYTAYGSVGLSGGDISTQGSLAEAWGLAQGLYDTSLALSTMDGLNEFRTIRVGELLEEFRTLQYWIASAPIDPPHEEDYYTEGWAVMRQCAIEGQHILDCAADTSVPEAASEEEQKKAELKQILLDAYSRRHQGQKIYSRQQAAQRWEQMRDQVLQSGEGGRRHQAQLAACDQQLRMELTAITDERVYSDLNMSDGALGRWTAEDPSLRSVQRWLRRRQ